MYLLDGEFMGVVRGGCVGVNPKDGVPSDYLVTRADGPQELIPRSSVVRMVLRDEPEAA
jgi:hypothetical protein